MTGRAAAALDLTLRLVAVDSVNPGLVPGAAGEAAVVALLRDRLRSGGWDVEVVEPPARPGRPSLVARHPGSTSGPTVVLNGHLDTVGVSGMDAPFTPRVEGDRLLGRGAADMKAGVAALVTTAEHLVRTGAPVRPVLALVADEEDASAGSEAVLSALPGLGVRPDVCVIAEPTDLAVAASLRGFAVVEVTFTGRAAHSSQPEEGVNAVTHLGRLLAAVDERSGAVAAAGGSLMVTVASGGESAFVVPARASCLVERRTVPGESAAGALAEVAALLRPEWRARARLVASREAWRLDPAGPAADLARGLGSRLGTGATFAAPYWMEAPLWQAACPTLVCGPGGGGLHSTEEWVSLTQLAAYAEALPDAVLAWAAGPG